VSRRFVVRPDHRHRFVRRWVVIDTTAGRIIAAHPGGPDSHLTEREARHQVSYLEQTHGAAA
jgi:hypothetical protein